MKKVILLALLMPCPAFGQIIENFESGNATNWVQSTEGKWNADTISAISGRFSLHHSYDNPEAGTDKVGIPVLNMHPDAGVTKWSFLIRHGYDPSSSNNWSAFLMSDAGPYAMSADGDTYGFALGVNLTGYDDTLRLWKVKGNILTTVVNCRINWQTTIGINDAVRLNIERTSEGEWTVWVYRPDGNLIGSASGTDSELFGQAWFGFYYRYSSTRDRLLWVDDISITGIFYDDNEVPFITGYHSSGKKSVEMTLNESPSAEFADPGNFLINGSLSGSLRVIKKNAFTYEVEFADNLMNKAINNLKISCICDNSGNCTRDVLITFTPVWAESGDIIISEIMPDPLPEVSLPGKEYLEIMNRSGYSLNLRNWNLSTEDQSFLIPETVIEPEEVVILCLIKDTSLFSKYGKVSGLKQFPSLTDAGRLLYLSDSSGFLIHGVEYSSEWYGDELKSAGGWSLEMKDTHFPFYSAENWTASRSRTGGTPGTANSVSCSNPDNAFYGVQNVFPDDSLNVRVRFSEPVLSLPFVRNCIKIGEKEIIEIVPDDHLFREFIVKMADPIIRGEVYQLEISDSIRDFAGNLMKKNIGSFGLPETPQSGDVMFNELLFNPFPGDPDYIELVNCSPRIVDASRLLLVSVNDGAGDTSQIYRVADEKRCIMPGSYYAVTTNRKRVSERYFSSDPDHLFNTEYLPSMSDDKGHLILYNRELDWIDEVYYNEKMHYSLLSGFEGISLEKTGPQNRSADPHNWHSAAESAGGGTPGAANSLFADLPSRSDKVEFSSLRITPDNDGYEDFLTIRFSLTGNGNIVSVLVFDETGNYLKKIASNIYAGPETSLIWDGTADDGSLVRTGIYIVLITLFDDSGKTERWKKVCTVIRN